MNFLIFLFFVIFEISGCPEETLKKNPNYQSPEEMVAGAGYYEQFETHIVESADGYILTLHRIRPSESCKCTKGVIVLQHSLFFGATQWFILPRNYSLAYLLVDLCYDVWLTNARGTCYSRKHKTLCETDKKYWDFSWHEMGYYDIPAFVDYVSSKTGRYDLILIAYSQGTSTAIVAASTRPELKRKISIMILLTPVAYTWGCTNCPPAAIEPLATQYTQKAGKFEVCPNKEFKNDMKQKFCDSFPSFCSAAFAICGYDPGYVDLENENDVCAKVDNVKRIEKELGNLVGSFKIDDKYYTHTNVYTRRRSKVLLYDKIIEVIEGLFGDYCSCNCDY